MQQYVESIHYPNILRNESKYGIKSCVGKKSTEFKGNARM